MKKKIEKYKIYKNQFFYVNPIKNFEIRALKS